MDQQSDLLEGNLACFIFMYSQVSFYVVGVGNSSSYGSGNFTPWSYNVALSPD